jgi:hypothetical protein
MNCYVTNPKDGSVYPSELDKDNTLFYPESGMTTMECFTSSRPRDFHIVTDCPYLVSLYDCKEVFIWRDGKWVNPDFQTYGCSFSIIIDNIFGYQHSIPQAVIDSKGVTNCMGYGIKRD